MPGWTDLKFWMACSWKGVWNDDPLPFSVPLSAAPLAEPVPVPVAAGGVVVLDEVHAAARRATAMAPPTTAKCLLPRSCISSFSLWVLALLAPVDRPGRLIALQADSRANRGVGYSLATQAI